MSTENEHTVIPSASQRMDDKTRAAIVYMNKAKQERELQPKESPNASASSAMAGKDFHGLHLISPPPKAEDDDHLSTLPQRGSSPDTPVANDQDISPLNKSFPKYKAPFVVCILLFQNQLTLI
jgi:hypothetical protein